MPACPALQYLDRIPVRPSASLCTAQVVFTILFVSRTTLTTRIVAGNISFITVIVMKSHISVVKNIIMEFWLKAERFLQ